MNIIQFFISIIFISCLCFIACSSPKKDYLEDEENTISISDTKVSVEEEKNEYVEIAEDIIDLGQSINQQLNENQKEKDSIYKLNKPSKWVIKIGDYASKEKYLLNDYLVVKDFGQVMTFKNNQGNYFLFFEEIGDEFELIEKLPSYRKKMGDIKYSLEVVDLNENCSRKETLIIDSPLIIGKRKNKFEIKCYACKK